MLREHGRRVHERDGLLRLCGRDRGLEGARPAISRRRSAAIVPLARSTRRHHPTGCRRSRREWM